MLSHTNRDLKDKAVKRLETYATHICMRCTIALIGEGDELHVNKTSDEFYKLKFLFNDSSKEPTKEIARTMHLICMSCVEKILKQDSIVTTKHKKMGANINIPPQVKHIQCKICEAGPYSIPLDV